LPASFFKKGLSENPRNDVIGVITSLFKKGLSEKTKQRRYRCNQLAQRLQPNGYGSTVALKKQF
jgi:hypothetical protein